MADRKRSFVMYHDYIRQFEMLSKNEQADLIMLILRYVNAEEYDTEELSGGVRMAFSFIRQRLDEDHAKYEEVCRKRSEAAKASKCRQMSANATDNDNVVVNDSDNDNDCDNVVIVDENAASQPEQAADADIAATTTKTNGKGFIAPSVEQVREYCNERHNTVDPQKFVDYYAAKGWTVGKNMMTDWKAAVRIWEKQEIRTAAPAGVIQPPSDPSYDIGACRQRTLDKYRNL